MIWVMKDATIIILNYNGQDLLKRFLPSVIAAAKKSPIPTAVWVADNGSSDESEDVVSKNKDVVWVPLKHNYGFGRGYNKAIKLCKSDFVVLLNSDIQPAENFLKPLITELEPKDVFATSCKQKVISHNRTYYSGGTLAEWSRGLLRHLPIFETHKDQIEVCKTFYPDGGACAVKREMFEQLGGFSSAFIFYWEDADLGFRAWKMGWKSLLVPSSMVEHYHETTISKVVTLNKKQALGFKGMLLFTWRAIDTPSLFLSHLFWLPFHLITAIFDKRLFRWRGLAMAMPSLNMRLEKNNYKKSTKEVIELSQF
jgi:GT2 family glycosyltransferase